MERDGTKFPRQPMDLRLAQVPEGRVHVLTERCKECHFCITYCPADVLEYAPGTNSKGYRFPRVADGKESACILCRFCDMICPELAIFTSRAPAQTASLASQSNA